MSDGDRTDPEEPARTKPRPSHRAQKCPECFCLFTPPWYACGQITACTNCKPFPVQTKRPANSGLLGSAPPVSHKRAKFSPPSALVPTEIRKIIDSAPLGHHQTAHFDVTQQAGGLLNSIAPTFNNITWGPCELPANAEVDEMARDFPDLIEVPHAYPATPAENFDPAAIILDPMIRVPIEPNEIFARVAPDWPKPEPKVGLDWWSTAGHHEVVIEFEEWNILYKKAPNHPKGAKFIHVDGSQKWFPTNWSFNVKRDADRWSKAMAFANHVFREDIDGDLVDPDYISTVRKALHNHVLVCRDGVRLSWAHVLMCIARGAQSVEEIETILFDRFQYENKKFLKLVDVSSDIREHVRTNEYEPIRDRFLAHLEIELPGASDRLKLPEHIIPTYEATFAQLTEHYGAVEQRRRNGFNVVPNQECNSEAQFTARALAAAHPLQEMPEVENDEFESLFIDQLNYRDHKRILRQRYDLKRDIIRVMEPFHKELMRHRPETSRRIGPNNSPLLIEAYQRLLKLDDPLLAFDTFWGFAIVEDIAACGSFPTVESLEEPQKDIMAGAREFVLRHNKRLSKGELMEGDRVMIDKTHAELHNLESVGVFDLQEVDEVFGENNWKCLIRFLAWSASKWREVDSGKASGHNLNTTVHNKLVVTDAGVVDKYATVARHIYDALPTHLRKPHFNPVISTEDLRRAYRQIPVAPDHLRYNISILPYLGRAKFIVLFALVFGLTSAVIQFNRCAYFLTRLCRAGLGITVINYFDDYLSIADPIMAPLVKRLLYAAGKALGWDFDPKKGITHSCVARWLGVMKRVSSLKVVSYICARRDKNIRDLIAKHLKERSLSKTDAQHLLGKFGFAGTTTYGRVGAVPLHALRKRTLEEHTTVMTDYIEEALIYMSFLLDKFGTAEILLNGSNRDLCVILSDASCDESRAKSRDSGGATKNSKNKRPGSKRLHVQLGWSTYMNRQKHVNGFIIVPQEYIDRWQKRQPIGIGETLAAFCAIKHAVGDKYDVDILMFIDNIGAERSIRRGSGKQHVSALISHELHLFLAERRCRIWTSYVQSRLNESDEPSRDGTLFGIACPEYQVSDFIDLDGVERRMRARGSELMVRLAVRQSEIYFAFDQFLFLFLSFPTNL